MLRIKGVTMAIILVVVIILITAAFAFRQLHYKTSDTDVKNAFREKPTTNQQTEEDSVCNTKLQEEDHKSTLSPVLWIGHEKEQESNRRMLIQMLSYADSLGLNSKDYRLNFIKTCDSLLSRHSFRDTAHKILYERIFSEAAHSFLFNSAYGRRIKISYDGLKYRIDSVRIENMFEHLMIHHNWRKTLDSIQPHLSEYHLLKNAYMRINAFIREFPRIETMGHINAAGIKVSVILKLKAYGIIDPSLNNDSVYGDNLKSALKRFQKMVKIDTTGKLDKSTTNNLQLTLATRLVEIKRSLNFWRWVQRLPERRLVLVNVAATRLQVIEITSKTIDMNIIVGQKDKQTPLFAAYLVNVTTYPHWVVPTSIATKEMLPRIARNVGYLERNNLEVMDYRGSILNPNKINWWKYSLNNFPFIIRQATGCDDALGVLKFDPSSPYDIYLHDTNAKNLFSRNYRYLSHGCIRLERPLELAKYLLEDRFDSMNVNYLNQCMKNEEPRDIKVKKKVPVVIYYLTAGINQNGDLEFYRDIYELEVRDRNWRY